jgi:Phage capsid family
MTFQMSRVERSEPAPLRRELPLPPGNSFVRLMVAKTIGAVRGVSPVEVADQMWPNDRIFAQVVTRAASAPAMTTVTGWAAELVQKVVSDALEALGPASAGAQVLRRGLVLNFDGGTISAPGLVAEFGNAGFVAEGQPIPVRQLAATAAQLLAHKLAAIGVLTREMVESSNAEQLVGDVLIRAAGRMLDEVLFDANPGDAARPAGLRNGVVATAASNNSEAIEAVFEDVAALINAVAPVAGNGPFVLVASPGRAAMMGFRFNNQSTNVTMLGSSAVVNDLLCIAPAALVSALSPEPDIETSTAATLHMDTAPGAVGTAGPHRSLFQIDAIALKMRWPATWALRDARGFAWMTPTWK